MSDRADDPRDLKTFNLLGVGGGTAISVVLVATAWGDWRKVAWIAGLLPVLGGLNVLIGALRPKLGTSNAESLRALLNLAASLWNATLLDWPLACWFFVPFLCVLVDGTDPRGTRIRLALQLLIWNVCALRAGVSPSVAVTFTFIGLFCYLVAATRVAIIERMLQRVSAQTAELATAHKDLLAMDAYARAQEKLAGLGMLAAGIAHQINNPMGVVSSNLNLLVEDLSTAQTLTPALIEHRDAVLPDVLEGVRRVNAIVSDLRRFARTERELPAAFDLREEADAAARILRQKLKPNQTLRCDFPETLPLVGMQRQLGQAMLNLLVNAAQSLGETGEIVIRGTRRPQEVEIAVSDSGSGMTPETLGKLFQPFFSTREVGQGTGLGLAVAHGIVQAHGGKIAVTSQLGRGSTFTMILPGRPAGEVSGSGAPF